jgi:hypothetical protein
MSDELPHDDISIRDLLRDMTYELKELRKEMHQSNSTVTALVRWKTGGEVPEKGVDVRLDRLEQAGKRQGRVVWGVLASVIGLVVSKAWDVLIKH